jgi:hypothetical protein
MLIIGTVYHGSRADSPELIPQVVPKHVALGIHPDTVMLAYVHVVQIAAETDAKIAHIMAMDTCKDGFVPRRVGTGSNS